MLSCAAGPYPSGIAQEHAYLGRCYAAEALCQLGDVHGAAEHLTTFLMQHMEEADLHASAAQLGARLGG